MKKIIALTLLAVGLAANSFGQGQVVLGNSTQTKVFTNGVASTSNTGGGVAIPANATQSYTFALLAYYTGSAATSTNAGTTVTATDNSITPWTDANWELVAYGVNGASGRVTDVNADEVVNNIGVGYYATLVMIGWETSQGGSTLTSMEAAYGQGFVFGMSAEGSIFLGNGTTPPNTSVMGTAPGNISGFTVAPVSTPEPGTMALAGLGSLSLLLFRRKK